MRAGEAIVKAHLLTFHRWIERAQTPFTPDLTIRIGSDLRYEALDIHRPGVPMKATPQQLLGNRVADHIPKELMFQFVSAAERSICLEAPTEMRYPMVIQGKVFMTRARVTAESSARVFITEILRLVGMLLVYLVPSA